ncbi:MAG: hypothetical protein HYU52_04090 [Acidobacteria bacterium]|nr:hypothetical protein [Acidobacteriota bacterium]
MTDQATTQESAPSTYLLVMPGGGFEELDRVAVRERIRKGDVVPGTDLSVAGTDAWRPAGSYPELARYFEMAAASPRTPSSLAEARPPRVVQSMGERIVGGLSYPVAGGEIGTLIGIAILSAIPIIGFLASLATTVVMLSIIRKSADGSTRMPPIIDTSSVWDMAWLSLRVLFVTLVALLPLIAFGVYGVASLLQGGMSSSTVLLGILGCLAFGMVYYPACLATIAVWDNALSALNPVYVGRVIRLVGGDYFVVIGIWFVATAVTTLLTMPGISPLSAIPIVGGIVSSILSLWALFYASHLLGYAIYRHAPELGWE